MKYLLILIVSSLTILSLTSTKEVEILQKDFLPHKADTPTVHLYLGKADATDTEPGVEQSGDFSLGKTSKDKQPMLIGTLTLLVTQTQDEIKTNNGIYVGFGLGSHEMNSADIIICGYFDSTYKCDSYTSTDYKIKRNEDPKILTVTGIDSIATDYVPIYGVSPFKTKIVWKFNRSATKDDENFEKFFEGKTKIISSMGNGYDGEKSKYHIHSWNDIMSENESNPKYNPNVIKLYLGKTEDIAELSGLFDLIYDDDVPKLHTNLTLRTNLDIFKFENKGIWFGFGLGAKTMEGSDIVVCHFTSTKDSKLNGCRVYTGTKEHSIVLNTEANLQLETTTTINSFEKLIEANQPFLYDITFEFTKSGTNNDNGFVNFKNGKTDVIGAWSNSWSGDIEKVNYHTKRWKNIVSKNGSNDNYRHSDESSSSSSTGKPDISDTSTSGYLNMCCIVVGLVVALLI